jgi:hypothetical protein
MTQKVTHHKKKDCHCDKKKRKRHRKNKKAHSTKYLPLSQRPALPPFSSIIPSPVSATAQQLPTNKPYYVELNSINPQATIKKEIKQEDKSPYLPFQSQMATPIKALFSEREKEGRHLGMPITPVKNQREEAPLSSTSKFIPKKPPTDFIPQMEHEPNDIVLQWKLAAQISTPPR